MMLKPFGSDIWPRASFQRGCVEQCVGVRQVSVNSRNTSEQKERCDVEAWGSLVTSARMELKSAEGRSVEGASG